MLAKHTLERIKEARVSKLNEFSVHQSRTSSFSYIWRKRLYGNRIRAAVDEIRGGEHADLKGLQRKFSHLILLQSDLKLTGEGASRGCWLNLLTKPHDWPQNHHNQTGVPGWGPPYNSGYTHSTIIQPLCCFKVVATYLPPSGLNHGLPLKWRAANFRKAGYCSKSYKINSPSLTSSPLLLHQPTSAPSCSTT